MPIYERNPKHKNWLHPFDPDAALCPAWSHDLAQSLLDTSLSDPSDSRRFNAKNGMAFAARRTRDDVWHGYPVPWGEVPEAIRQRFLNDKRVTIREIKRLLSSEALANELEPGR